MVTHELSQLSTDKGPWTEFLRTASLSMGVYRLGIGVTDNQKPHREEEVYYVVRGRARFLAGDREVPVGPGQILFVEAGEVHQFLNIEEDLELLVFFAPPEGSNT